MTDRPLFLRDGSSTDPETWRKKQGDAAYVQVATDELAGGMWVSTIWTGIDDGTIPSADGRALIFESVVFDRVTRKGLDRNRWPDETSAREGHAALVAKWSRQ